MIGFVVAMEKEARLFLSKTQIIEEKSIASKKVFCGKYSDKDFVLIVTGIGKVNATIGAQVIIDKFNPEYIINFGVAGGKEGSDLHAGDVVLLDKVCQYDFDLSEIDNVSIGYMQDYDTIYYDTAIDRYNGKNFIVRSGATGDRFTNKEYFLSVIKDLNAQVVDMESGAIAQVCKSNNIPYLSLKLISDVDGVEGSIFEQYSNNVEAVCCKVPESVEALVNNINI